MLSLRIIPRKNIKIILISLMIFLAIISDITMMLIIIKNNTS